MSNKLLADKKDNIPQQTDEQPQIDEHAVDSQDSQNSEDAKTHIDNRHLFRQIVVQTLYQRNYINQKTDTLQKLTEREPEIENDLEMEFVSSKLARKLRKNLIDLEEVVSEILKHQDKIDQAIAKLAPAWPINQINPVDLQIMRLEIYEGFIAETVPAKVAIDEAIELARDFGTESNVKFVSGVLGNLYADDKMRKNLVSTK